ncbi:MAG: Haloacid dehalogenase domain protein hydrolase [Sphingomonadales bacterium]|jgi:predicted HAD superfamily hydrolase|nr:Haloacid dehalogenase domain protein hydrolase [Sphingomonadales bacterium]
MNKKLDAAWKRIVRADPRIISCDVFDTLLNRNHISESSRVKLIARRAASMLEERCGVRLDADAIWRTRVDVQHYAYRALDMIHPTGEVQFTRMMEATATLLGLGAPEAAVLARAEVAVEQTQLTPNLPLLSWLTDRAAEGIKVIAISDTWHDAPTIRALLDGVAPDNPVATVYTSSDCNATKRSGAIFPMVIAAERMPAETFFHIGDDELADERMSRRAGLHAHRITPPRMVMMYRRLNGAHARLRHRMPQR